MIEHVISDSYRSKRSILPYASMLVLTFGIVLLIFGGMIDGAARRPFGPILSTVTIPTGIGLIIFGGMLRKHTKKTEAADLLHRPAGSNDNACGRCKTSVKPGAAYCRNCGQKL